MRFTLKTSAWRRGLLIGVSLLTVVALAQPAGGAFASVLSRGVAHLTIYLPALALYFIVLPRFYGFSTLGQPLQLFALASLFVLATSFMGQAAGAWFKPGIASRGQEKPVIKTVGPLNRYGCWKRQDGATCHQDSLIHQQLIEQLTRIKHLFDGPGVIGRANLVHVELLLNDGGAVHGALEQDGAEDLFSVEGERGDGAAIEGVPRGSEQATDAGRNAQNSHRAANAAPALSGRFLSAEESGGLRCGVFRRRSRQPRSSGARRIRQARGFFYRTIGA